MEIFPFLKLMWRSRAIEEEWDPLRGRIMQASHFAEVESVRRGLRRCDVYQFDTPKFDEQINRAVLWGLYPLAIVRSKSHEGFGHKHYLVKNIEMDTMVYGVIANTLSDAITFHDAGVTDLSRRIRTYDAPFKIGDEVFEMNPNGIDHNVTGALLGYAKCDRDFFDEVWLKDGNYDPEYEIAMNTEGCLELTRPNHLTAEVYGNPLLNRLTRYWGFQIIPFFSHSFDCPEALKFAEWWVKLMREKDEEAVEKCLELLRMPMRWSVWNGIIEVRTPLFVGAANGYFPKVKKEVIWNPN